MKKFFLNLVALVSVVGSTHTADIMVPVPTQAELPFVVPAEQTDEAAPQEEGFEKYKKAVVAFVREHQVEIAIVSGALLLAAVAMCYQNSIVGLFKSSSAINAGEIKKAIDELAPVNGTVPTPAPQPAPQPQQPAVVQPAAPVDSQDVNRAASGFSYYLDKAKEAGVAGLAQAEKLRAYAAPRWSQASVDVLTSETNVPS